MSIKVGAKAPVFLELKPHIGQKIVLYFYPKDDTPGCTQEACDFRDHFSEFKKQKIKVLGVSRDTEIKHEKFKAKYDLPFDLVADVDGKICEKYGVWQEKQLYGKKFMGIVRTTVLINEDGKISAIFPKVKVKEHVSEILETWKQLKSEEK